MHRIVHPIARSVSSVPPACKRRKIGATERARANMSSFRELSPPRALSADISLRSRSIPVSLSFSPFPSRSQNRSTSILNRCRPPLSFPRLSRYIFSYLSFEVYCFYPRITETRGECTYLSYGRNDLSMKQKETREGDEDGDKRAAAVAAGRGGNGGVGILPLTLSTVVDGAKPLPRECCAVD